MPDISITFPHTSTVCPAGSTIKQAVFDAYDKDEAKQVLAAVCNGELVDLSAALSENATVTPVTFDSPEGREIFWHSASHVLAMAVKQVFPDAKPAIGPAVENGFYYDFDVEKPFTDEDLKKISKAFKKCVGKNIPFERVEMSRDEAIALFKEKNEPYKVEILEELEDGTVSAYKNGDDFIDLCRGPHVSSTVVLKAVKLLRAAGAYWRGDEKNKQLQRIYGVAFPQKDQLAEHLAMLEEAEKRNHIRLGKELDLFVMNETVGKGLPLLTPRGATIKRTLRRFIEDEEMRRGYQFTETPVLAKSDLYKISGHLDHYRESMFVFEANDEEMVLRPMTCPHQFMIYKSRKRSYRDLPIRYAEVADLFRNEQSGELHGLIRIRQFTLADAHIICLPEQLEQEFTGVVDLVQYVMKTLGFEDFWYRFSKWDPAKKDKYIDNPEAWARSQSIMKEILDKLELNYEEADGEAAFYGPKLDVQMKNVYGKEDTVFTIQIDFALPERFGLTYIGEDSKEHSPMIIHRSSIGCLERTMAMLIEHYAGAFPVWLAPVQAVVAPVSEKTAAYAGEVAAKLRERGVRVELDDRNEKIGYKIREAEMQKVPYLLVVGPREAEAGEVAVRKRREGDLGGIPLDGFIATIAGEIDNKTIF